ncbi:polysaccharide biosynthesis/export family protein [Paraburkholderia unamae]|uniref:Polysaccharide export outer membrane protein n=2 Tax=Paraburkholderia unamae TaxID=219649 RepID=A0ABX5KK66_9BURK|nr:polysaccharide biosynthesis/export family protein [Paraburkholderia unamae]PVX82251.1 polysaccharide export outer membrane protein [Paraburkholderia unamae]
MQTKNIIAGLAVLSLGACSLTPGGFFDESNLREPAPPAQQTAPPVYDVLPINAQYFIQHPDDNAALLTCPLTCLTPATRAAYVYHIGINDSLQVIVWDHPELTSQGGAGTGTPPLPGGTAGGVTGGAAAGGAAGSAGGATGGGGTLGGVSGGGQIGGLELRVAADGTIFFPRVGRVKVVGLTAEEVQQKLTQGLSRTIRNPQLDVRVTGFNSKQIQVLGDVRVPQGQAITDMPMSIVDALNRAGGAQQDADLQNVGVTRDGVRHQIDVDSLVSTGNIQQNVLLRDGDIVDVPDRSNSRVFVLGEIAHPSIVPMNRGKLTLADAIANANSIDNRTSNPHAIYVIRGIDPQPGPNHTVKTKLATPQVFRLDMTQVDSIMLMTRFELAPRDVVYVQIAQSARFNRLLDLITPSLQTIFFTKELVNP